MERQPFLRAIGGIVGCVCVYVRHSFICHHIPTYSVAPLSAYTLPPTQHHSFFRNLPPLFICVRLRLIIKSGSHSSHVYHQLSVIWEIDASVLITFIKAYLFQVNKVQLLLTGRVVLLNVNCYEYENIAIFRPWS